MSMQDIRGFVELLEECGELRRIVTPVDADLEIAAITERCCKLPGGGPALFFDKVKGSEIPVLTNLFGSIKRMGWALWTDNLDLLAQRIARDLEKVEEKGAENGLARLIDTPMGLPRLIKQGSCQECVQREGASFDQIPALRSWPGDGGRYLTLPLVFTREAGTGRGNCGMYRVQLLDERRAVIHWAEESDGARHYRSWQARGKAMPMAIALGGDLALIYTAGAPLPGGLDEVAFAGYLRRHPISMVRCLSCALQIPAAAEIVLEGYLHPSETAIEGPFANHTGYYVPAAPSPVFHLTTLTTRRHPLYPCTVVGPPPMETAYLAKAGERIFLPLLQFDCSEVQDINFPVEGIYHGAALISLKPEAEGQGRLLLQKLQNHWLFKRSRLLAVYNSEVDVQNPASAYWHALNCVRADVDAQSNGLQILIDATVRQERKPVVADAKIMDLVDQRWNEYGFPVTK
ncbi:MAG: UbiD family decarboxylase [Trichloromonas sp.]|jgi:4-hydroxy-3-polyprenylbenzoate decarboxylase|nr:UbiD family decarboxylase [Trichloromonas sp.]